MNPSTKTKSKKSASAITHENTATTNEEMTMTTKIKTPKSSKSATHASTTNEETTMTPKTTTTTTAANTSATGSTSTGLAALVTQLSAALDAAEAQLGPNAPAITASDKKRTGKPRKGSDKVLAQLAPVVEQYGLNSDSLNTSDMMAQYQAAQTLLPLQARLQKVTKRVDDEVFNAQTGSWEMGLQFYSLLQRRAKSNGDVAKSIEPLTKVFAYRHPGMKKVSKETTREKDNVTKSVAAAEKHGVKVAFGTDGSVQTIVGPNAAAAVADLAAQGVTVGASNAANGGTQAMPATPVAAPVAAAPASTPAGVATAGH